jgi:hypothetical protein
MAGREPRCAAGPRSRGGVPNTGRAAGRSRRATGPLRSTPHAAVERRESQGEHHQGEDQHRKNLDDLPDVEPHSTFRGRKGHRLEQEELAPEWTGAADDHDQELLCVGILRRDQANVDEDFRNDLDAEDPTERVEGVVLGQPSVDRFLKPETIDIKGVPENTTGQLKIDVTLAWMPMQKKKPNI